MQITTNIFRLNNHNISPNTRINSSTNHHSHGIFIVCNSIPGWSVTYWYVGYKGNNPSKLCNKVCKNENLFVLSYNAGNCNSTPTIPQVAIAVTKSTVSKSYETMQTACVQWRQKNISMVYSPSFEQWSVAVRDPLTCLKRAVSNRSTILSFTWIFFSLRCCSLSEDRHFAVVPVWSLSRVSLVVWVQNTYSSRMQYTAYYRYSRGSGAESRSQHYDAIHDSCRLSRIWARSDRDWNGLFSLFPCKYYPH